MKLQGKVWKYGDNIDTDVIIPARYLVTTDPQQLAQHCMEDIDQQFASQVQPGDIIVGGRNFGCGSSREHAPISIKGDGCRALSPNPSRESSSAMRSTLGCRFWKARKPSATRSAATG